MNNQERIEAIKKLIIKGHNNYIVPKTFKVFGYQYNYYTTIFGDLNLYWFADHEVKEAIIPLNQDSKNNNRPGKKKQAILYVCVHDTASSAPTAGALAHSNYLHAGGGGTSWHYSCGDDVVYHQIPDDEIAYHAGDGLQIQAEYTNTNVHATTLKPLIEINDGYYYFNGQKSTIKVPNLTLVDNLDGTYSLTSMGVVQKNFDHFPNRDFNVVLTTKHINDQGLKTIIKEDGNYYLAPTYYNYTYGYIANRLGNLYSIGIETMVNEGSNLLKTYHRCAKLCAHLIKKYHLTIDDVVPHHYFSGKPCPQTMRYNQMWDTFKAMVEIEYEILMLLGDDGKIGFECNNTNVDLGIINNDLEISQKISYTVEIKIGSLSEKITLESKYSNINI